MIFSTSDIRKKKPSLITTVLLIGMLIGVYEVHTSNYNSCFCYVHKMYSNEF